MLVAFTLSMPKNNSWNGKWTGEDRLYVIIHNFGRTKKGELKGQKVLDGGSYSHCFGDGWVASISVKLVDARKAQSLRMLSKGFCGYDWMVKSIVWHGDIRHEG